MRRPLAFLAALALASTAAPAIVSTPAAAQVVETPVAFDSAGRVTALTPGAAARLELRPPAWRVTGDFTDARLFRLSDSAYVMVVTRRNGAVERYSLTREDRDYLLAKTANLPPGFESAVTGAVTGGVGRAARAVGAATRSSAFIRDQSILGVVAYGPSFAAAVTNNDAARVATWLIVAGGTFFGASEIARDYTIAPAQTTLSTHGGLHGALGGGALAYALGAGHDGVAAGAFVGGIGGAAGGLVAGRRLTVGQARAAGFGADVTALASLGALGLAGAFDSDNVPPRARAAIIAGAGLVGYPLGARYASSSTFNVTPGDVSVLAVTTTLGTALGGAFVVDRDHPSDRTVALALTTGGIAGLAVGDHFFVRRFDHSDGDAGLLSLGAGAGALIGLGTSVLLDRSGKRGALALSLGTVGSIGGLAVAERYTSAKLDERRSAVRINFTPSGLALAAVGVRGSFPVLGVEF
ncbi:MAG TPA: hypothetical protein VFJ74_10440 [Gemmatimonadaceae bacterium]|nr:hypothetical protein [Gemmatimonadaceae bacterium]